MKKSLCFGLVSLSLLVGAASAFADGSDGVTLGGVVHPSFVAEFISNETSNNFKLSTTSTSGVTIEVIPISVDSPDSAQLSLEMTTFVVSKGESVQYDAKTIGVSAGVVRIIVSDN